jgi:hypothetical protein
MVCEDSLIKKMSDEVSTKACHNNYLQKLFMECQTGWHQTIKPTLHNQWTPLPTSASASPNPAMKTGTK